MPDRFFQHLRSTINFRYRLIQANVCNIKLKMESDMHKALSIVALIILMVFTPQLFAGAETDANGQKLKAILDSQDDETKARYQYRHPLETLQFFGIEPGMTVLEALPGEVWYSKMLIPYLGKEGHLIAVDYSLDMWRLFDWAKEDFIEERKNWAQAWLVKVKTWDIADGSAASAYTFNTLPEDKAGTVDAALFIRAMHNLSRFEADGKYFSDALKETYRVLKPGGILGVIQHSAPHKDLTGSTGYMERDSLVKRIEAFGFKLLAESDINANPKDKPKANDIVWRLPPTLYIGKDDEELRKRYLEIGESNRMMLKFVKPVKNSRKGLTRSTL
jgi:predicted methyltransferase